MIRFLKIWSFFKFQLQLPGNESMGPTFHEKIHRLKMAVLRRTNVETPSTLQIEVTNSWWLSPIQKKYAKLNQTAQICPHIMFRADFLTISLTRLILTWQWCTVGYITKMELHQLQVDVVTKKTNFMWWYGHILMEFWRFQVPGVKILKRCKVKHLNTIHW